MNATEQKGAWFPTTRWTLITLAGAQSTAESTAALEQLCRTYWYPLYAYVRRSGQGPEEAQDLTQDFFAHLLSNNALATVDKAKGRFRSFLLVSLNHFLINNHARAQAVKRGGGAEVFSLDSVLAENRYSLEPVSHLAPDKLFERRWALVLLDQALARLRAEYEQDDRSTQFEWLREFLYSEETERPYAEVGAERGLKPAAVASAVYRFRQRYRELVRQEIAQTVSGPEELEEELHWLFGVLS